MEFLKGYKLKLLGLAWAALAAVDGLGGINILASVDATNWMDNIMFGFGVFAGRDALDSLFEKIKAEMAAR
jgi:hypothetical protein